MLESKILQFLNAFHAIIHIKISFALLWSKIELSSKDHKSTSSSDKGKFYTLFILTKMMLVPHSFLYYLGCVDVS